MRHVPAAAAHRSSCHALLRADYLVHRPVSCCAVGAAIINGCPPGALAAAALLQLALRCLLPGGAAGSAHPHTAGQGEAGGSSQCACTDALPNTGTAACKAPVMEGARLSTARHAGTAAARWPGCAPSLQLLHRLLGSGGEGQAAVAAGDVQLQGWGGAKHTRGAPNEAACTVCLPPLPNACWHAGCCSCMVAPPLEAPALTLPSSQHAAGAARGRPSTGCPSSATRRRYQCLRGQKAKASLEYALSMGACLPLRSLTAVAAAVV